MNEEERIEIEHQLQPLLRDDTVVPLRRELLERLVHDDEAKEVLAEMLRDRRDARAAFGYGGVDEAIQDSWKKVKASLRSPGESSGSESSSFPGRRTLLGRRIVPWLSAVAAMVVMAASLFVALTAVSAKRLLEDRLARLEESIAAPAMAVSETQMAEYRRIWSLVAQRPDTWVLVHKGEADFGSTASAAPSPDGGAVVLLQCRILDETSRRVYAADLLMPGAKGVSFHLADAGSVAGRPARVDVAVGDAEATVAFSIDGGTVQSAGVAGRTRMGDETKEIGRFFLNDQTLRVYVRARYVPGIRA